MVKVESTSSKIRNNTRKFTLTSFMQHYFLKVQAMAIRGKKIRLVQK